MPELPRLRVTPTVLRGITDRTRTTAMFEGFARQAPYAALLRGPGRTELVISDPGLARAVLVTQGRSFGKGQGLRRTRFLLGQGLLTADRDLHRRQRPVVQPAFARARLARYAEDMVAAAQELVATWRPGQVVDMAVEMQRLTLDAVGSTLLGSRTGAEAARIRPALATVLRAWEVALLPGVERLRETRLPGAVRTRAAIAELDAVVRGVVAEARRTPDGDDVVHTLLRSQDELGVDDQQVRDEVMTLLLAGHETTANALTWTLSLLSDAPQVADRVRRELAAAVGDRPASYADLPALPYTYAVVAESLRLYPPAWILEREALEDVEVGGIDVPQGAQLVMCTWALHRDPRSWVAPRAFRPDRWLDADGRFDEAAPGQPKGAWQPFGGGTRVCIGESFAWTEAVVMLSVLLRAYAPRREPDQVVATRAAIALRPAYGMRMRLLPLSRQDDVRGRRGPCP